MSRRSDLTLRKKAAEDSIRANAAGLAAITAADPVVVPEAHQTDATPEIVAAYEVLAQALAAIAALEARIAALETP